MRGSVALFVSCSLFVACAGADSAGGPVPSSRCTADKDCSYGVCDVPSGKCMFKAQYLGSCASATCVEGSCLPTSVGNICTRDCGADGDCVAPGLCVLGRCVPPCTSNVDGTACIGGRPIPCSEPAAKAAACAVCGCAVGQSCFADKCSSPQPIEKIGALPPGQAAESIAVGATRVFLGTSRDSTPASYKGDVFASPKSGGVPTLFVADAGTSSELAVDAEDLYVFSARFSSGSDSIYRLEHIDAAGTRNELAHSAAFANCTDIALHDDMIYLACLGGQPSSSSPWPSTLRRLSKTGGPLETVGTMDTIFRVGFADAWVYWIGSGASGVSRRRVDLSTDVESLAAVENHVYRGIDAASSTAWWSTPGGVKRYDWSTKNSTVFATGKNCGIFVRAGAAVWRTCRFDNKPQAMHFVPASGGAITSWLSSASGPVSVDADYVYYTEGTDILRVRRPDR